MNEIEAVDLVDKLMRCFRNGVTPYKDDIIQAYNAGINVSELERYIKEVELEEYETYEEYEWNN